MTTTVPYVAMGSVPVNATRTVRFELRNWTAAPIRIVGARNAYGFVVLDELPVTIAAHQSIPFSVDLKTNSFKSSGLFDIQFQLLLDRPSFPIHLRISAFVDATRTENSNHLVASDGGLK